MYHKPLRTERFIQFGAGGFLRGFADWMIQKLNDVTDFEGSVVAVQVTPHNKYKALAAQNYLYTHIQRGAEGTEVNIIDVISRLINPFESFEDYLSLAEIPTLEYVISNTTEAGIVFDPTDKKTDSPPSGFPAKVTLLLKQRYALGLPGFTFLPCELIDRNADKLKKCILQYADLWNLGEDFSDWVKTKNTFCCTLVDRINTGFPHDDIPDTVFADRFINASEFFHLWVIEADPALADQLPFKEAGLNVIITKDGLEQYRSRKVRILNGAHTALVPYALLKGFDTVRSCMDDKEMRAYLHSCIFDEIIPTLDLPTEELTEYANSVLTRFENPYIRHYLSSIALNSVSKFKVRVLPSILEYKKRFGVYPRHLMFAFRMLLEFYKTDMVNDDPGIAAYMKEHSPSEILANAKLWDMDLSPLTKEIENAAP